MKAKAFGWQQPIVVDKICSKYSKLSIECYNKHVELITQYFLFYAKSKLS